MDLHRICAQGNHQELRSILEHNENVNINIKDELDESPLHYACGGQHIECVRLLLEHNVDHTMRENLGNTAFHYACGSIECMELLLNAGIPINVKNRIGYTALHFLCDYGDEYVDNIQYLIDHGADLNCLSNSGDTPLHISCSYGNFECVKLLIAHGANPHILNIHNQLPIDNALSEEYMDIVDYLNMISQDCDIKEPEPY